MRHKTKLTQGCSQVASSHWSINDCHVSRRFDCSPDKLTSKHSESKGLLWHRRRTTTGSKRARHTPHRSWLCQGTASQHFGELTAFTTARPLDIFWTSQPVMPSMSDTTMEPPTSHFRLTNIKLHQLTRKDLFLPFVLQCSWRRPTWLKFRRGALPHAESHQGVPWELGPWSWKIP